MKVLATAIRQEKEIKGIQIGKEKVKLSLFADDTIMYIENPIDSTKTKHNRPHKLIWTNSGIQNQYSEIEGILYTNNKISETDTRKKIPFDIATRKIKYKE